MKVTYIPAHMEKRELKDFDYYMGLDLDIITRPVWPMKPNMSDPEEIREYADKIENYNKLKKKYDEDLKNIKHEKTKRLNEFKTVVLEISGLSKYERADEIYEKIWEDFHDESLEVVYEELKTWGDFITSAINQRPKLG